MWQWQYLGQIQKQTIVSIFTIKIEYQALAKEAYIEVASIPTKIDVHLYCNNISAIKFIKKSFFILILSILNYTTISFEKKWFEDSPLWLWLS